MAHERSKAIVMQINSVFKWRMTIGRKQNNHQSKVQSIKSISLKNNSSKHFLTVSNFNIFTGSRKPFETARSLLEMDPYIWETYSLGNFFGLSPFGFFL